MVATRPGSVPPTLSVRLTPQLEPHRLPEQPLPERLGLACRLEAGASIEAHGRAVTESDAQVKKANIPVPCPRDHRFKQHLASSETAIGWLDPQLVQACDVWMGALDAAPGKTDRLTIKVCDQGDVPAFVGGCRRLAHSASDRSRSSASVLPNASGDSANARKRSSL